MEETIVVECSRQSSIEGTSNNYTSLADWTCDCGSGIVLDIGDKIQVHSGFVSEKGAQAGEIEIKERVRGDTVTVNVSKEIDYRYPFPFPDPGLGDVITSKEIYSHQVELGGNEDVPVTINDGKTNFIYSPYLTTNGEFYASLPRRHCGWNASITATALTPWEEWDSHTGVVGNVIHGPLDGGERETNVNFTDAWQFCPADYYLPVLAHNDGALIKKGMIRNDTEENGGGTNSTTAITFYNGSDWKYFTSTESQDSPPIENFNTVLYTGSTSPHAITGVGFQPDLIWIKNRDQPDSYAIVDSVRGITSPAPYIASDRTDAQFTSTSMPTSVQSDGFTITGNGGRTNTSGEDYVAWCFKAGGAAVSNTDGATTSQVSANQDLGFSIVKNTGTGSNTDIGHGLGVSPELVITKNTTDASNWSVSGSVGGLIYGTNKLALQKTDGLTNDTNEIRSVSSTTISPGSSGATNGSGDNIIHYCFASKQGLSKVGSYTGNGSNTGPVVYTGFEPAFVIIKASSRTGYWIMLDNKRNPSDPRDNPLYANVNWAEDVNQINRVDFNGDGLPALNYDATANTNQVSATDVSDPCIAQVFGCTDSTAFNYDPLANVDNGTCIATVYGCTDDYDFQGYLYTTYPNYLPGFSTVIVSNYNPNANTDDGSCLYYDATTITGAGVPYWLNDTCYAWVVYEVDPYCLNNQWDAFCQSQYNYCEFGTPLSLEDMTRDQIMVYPNPTRNKINIKSKNEVDVDVYDLLGNHVLYQKKAKEVDMVNLPSGVYNLRITFKGIIINHKIIKQ